MNTKEEKNIYANSKVYKIVDNTNNNIYIGSTTQKKLSQRLAQHNSKYKAFINGTSKSYLTSFKIIENGNYDIILLESINCNSKEELRARERYYIENFECINKNIPNRTIKEYYEANKNEIKEQQKEYYEANKNEIKEYYEANKNEIKEQQKEYREANKEHLKQKAKQKILCPHCNTFFNYSGKNIHNKSKRHLDALN